MRRTERLEFDGRLKQSIRRPFAQELEAWLKRSDGAPQDVAMRQRVRSRPNSVGISDAPN